MGNHSRRFLAGHGIGVFRFGGEHEDRHRLWRMVGKGEAVAVRLASKEFQQIAVECSQKYMVKFMRRFLLVVFFLLPLASPAHVGSPDVYYDGYAGPYRLLVTLRPP